MNKKFSGEKKSFLWAFLISLLVFLPFIIYNDGVFVYMGDYNVQQIPFYKLAHEAVRSGDIFWNWNTDLGANFIGSYSFYLLFSPFFWLTLPFPTDFLPYLMGPLLILKTSLAALTSFLYIKRYVKDKNYAVVGSLLYAFSGFMIFNIFFNHFHDVVVFFPLLLVSLDELAENNRRGWFAFMVAVSAMVNYWFFIGEVVFVVIYVFIRIFTDKKWRSFKKFSIIALESILGVGIACFVLLPSALAIMGNPRTGAGKLINGELLWVYGFRQRLPAIIESFFFPPEIPSRPTFFPEMGAKWASLSAWLPLFSTVGTIAYLKYKKQDTVKRVIITSLIMSLVPVFNSAFVLFNGSYYARWFYMPILFLCIATSVILEDRNKAKSEINSGLMWTAGFVLIMALGVAFTPVRDGDKICFGLYDNKAMFIYIAGYAVICLVIAFSLLVLLRESRWFLRVTSFSLSVIIVAFSLGYMADGKSSKRNDDAYLDLVLNGREEYQLPDDEFYRTDFYKCKDNMGMMLGKPTINAFHSIVPPSVMEFYPYVGIKRDVSTKPPVSHEALRPLTSVKYLFVKADEKDQPPMTGYSLYKEYKDYNIYENDSFLPMGIFYEEAVSKDKLSEFSGEQKLRYMLTALCLEEEDIEKYSDILSIHTSPDYFFTTSDMINAAIEQKRDTAAHYFKKDTRGFTSKIDAPGDGLLFFSVPYDKGWTATVNGEEAEIVKANVGFMAVKIPEGESTVRFNYMTPGLIPGLLVSAVSASLLIIYLLICMLLSKKGRKRNKAEDNSISIRRYEDGETLATERIPLSDALGGKTKLKDFSQNTDSLITPEDIKKGDIFKE